VQIATTEKEEGKGYWGTRWGGGRAGGGRGEGGKKRGEEGWEGHINEHQKLTTQSKRRRALISETKEKEDQKGGWLEARSVKGERRKREKNETDILSDYRKETGSIALQDLAKRDVGVGQGRMWSAQKSTGENRRVRLGKNLGSGRNERTSEEVVSLEKIKRSCRIGGQALQGKRRCNIRRGRISPYKKKGKQANHVLRSFRESGTDELRVKGLAE